MSRWISTGDELPEEDERVVIWLTTSSVIDKNGRPIVLDAATFHSGKTAEECERTNRYGPYDQHANNTTPYAFKNGPMLFFGQTVSHWMRLEPPA